MSAVFAAAFMYEARRQNAVLSVLTATKVEAFNQYYAIYTDLIEEHIALYELLYNAGKADEESLYDRAKLHLYKVRDATTALEQTLKRNDASADQSADFTAFRNEVRADALTRTRAYREGATTALRMATTNLELAPRELALASERFHSMNVSLLKFLEMESNAMQQETRAVVRRNDADNTAIALIGLSFAALLLVLSVLLARLLSRSIEAQVDSLIELGMQAGTRFGPAGSDQVERMANAIAAFRQSLAEKKRDETSIKRLNRVYAVLSGINTLIVRVRDRDELFREACRIAVELGRFSLAWIGVVDLKANVLVPVAWVGLGREYADKFRLKIGDPAPETTSLAAEALREKRAAVSNDIAHDPRVVLLAEMVAQGLGSAVVLPLIVDGVALGTLTLVATERGFFDDKEMKLLTELAGDIGFAMDHINKETRLDYLTFYDALTGLANRNLFLDRVAQHMRSALGGGHNLALFLIDLERFRNINDSLGWPAGDALLKQVAEWLTRTSGDASLVARVGADQFAVVLPEVKPADGVRSLQKSMADFLEHPFRLNDAVFRIAIKVGVATFPDDGADAETLLKNTEAALKQAKASGERFMFYTHTMNQRVAEKLTLENQLRHALERDEFVLHYQPKVDLETRSIVGVEALIRWQRPEIGLVPPMKFISLLEETGLILPVGTWALKRASLDHRRWVDQGLKAPRVAVNVSPIQLRQRDFVSVVEQAIFEGVAPTGIDLEITESILMEDIQGNIEKLKSVRDLGVRIAIDDFGTGYSSLGYLAKLPVQTLKIDRSFIITMLKDPGAMTLVQTMISLAHSLKLKVVAEGVDEEEQAKVLRLLDCDEMQGYLFSRPVPFDQMTNMLTQASAVKVTRSM